MKFLLNIRIALFAATFFLFGLAAGFWLWGGRPAASSLTLVDALAGDDPAWGPPDAPIVIVEFGDYECPYCRDWHRNVWPRLREAYPNQLRLVFRDFPLIGIHLNAAPAAEAAACAAEQGQFWPFHDLLYGNDTPLGQATYESYARQLGLNLNNFRDCLQEGRGRQEVRQDFADAATLGLNSTPTFFINGLRIVGAQSYEDFLQYIEQISSGRQ